MIFGNSTRMPSLSRSEMKIAGECVVCVSSFGVSFASGFGSGGATGDGPDVGPDGGSGGCAKPRPLIGRLTATSDPSSGSRSSFSLILSCFSSATYGGSKSDSFTNGVCRPTIGVTGGLDKAARIC